MTFNIAAAGAGLAFLVAWLLIRQDRS